MKKQAILFCALAVPAPILAHASVTLYGVVDVGVSHYRVSGGDSVTGMSNHGLTSSRFGFRGKEDLGNGMAAEFVLEGGFDASSPGPFSLSRRATLGLSGRWGEVRLGRDYTPTYNIMSSFSGPWVTNGVGESLVYRARAFTHGSANGGQSTNVRSSNAINYFLPKDLGGVYGQFMYTVDAEAEDHAGRYVGGRLGYRSGPWNVAVAYNTAKGGPGAPATRPRDMKNFSLGGSYKFGFGTLEALLVNDRIEMPLGDKKLRGLSAGLTVPAGSGEIRATYGHVRLDYPGEEGKADKVALGYVHNLSKRTALYTTVAYLRNRDGASFTVGGLTGVANRSSAGVDVGIRHRF